MTAAFVLMIDTVAQGRILAERNGLGCAVIYLNRAAAEKAVAEDMIIQYQDVIDGNRTLDEVDDSQWVEPVTIQEDGQIIDERGVTLANMSQPLPY